MEKSEGCLYIDKFIDKKAKKKLTRKGELKERNKKI